MFERRLKVFLFFLAIMTAVLIARAVQIQLLDRARWTNEASKSLQEKTFIETTRGRLLDCLGRPIALDVASMDACVDYRAITAEPDPAWVHNIAAGRAVAQYGSRPGKQRIAEAVQDVKHDIAEMWKQLAREGDESDDEMDAFRRSIVHRVEMSRRYLWYHKKQSDDAAARRAADVAAHPTSMAATKPTTAPAEVPPAIQAWLNGETDVAPSDDFDIKVAEQSEPHVILRAIRSDAYNRLGKQQEHYPGLVLRSNMDRTYPFHDLACHVVGHLTDVEAKDLASDPDQGDELRQYKKSDEIGRSGLESLCEPLLRGSRGRHSYWTDEAGAHDDTTQPQPGRDVQTTLDLDLEKQIREAFDQVPVSRLKEDPEEHINLHGAAVVLDVATNSVRAMVSVPTFDANRFDELYSSLSKDILNEPLLNRATDPRETGSTIKPVVGIGAITQGVMGLNDTIECTGYLVIAGHRYPFGRCWVASKFEHLIPSVAHHPIPTEAPHPTGFLTFPDALERSCNIFFENMGDRLGLDGLSHWMDVFGLGRATGIGIPEARGRLPNSAPRTLKPEALNQAKWFAGIGQGYVSATPLQMANVAATIARDGVWMRPHLVPTETLRELARLTPSSSGNRWFDVPEKVVLPISPQAVAAAKDGMRRVANSLAGTGRLERSNRIERQDSLIAAGKTGTAQAAHFVIPTLDENGKPVLDEKGTPLRVALEPSTYQKPNKLAPWYLGFGDKGTEVKHAWYIGYAPADHPRVAFAVLVEYGGSGGTTAEYVANKILDACIDHGYLPEYPAVRPPATTTTAP